MVELKKSHWAEAADPRRLLLLLVELAQVEGFMRNFRRPPPWPMLKVDRDGFLTWCGEEKGQHLRDDPQVSRLILPVEPHQGPGWVLGGTISSSSTSHHGLLQSLSSCDLRL